MQKPCRCGERSREGLPKGGYAEWQNIDFEVRPAEGKLDLLPSLATELVAIKVDVIVAIFTPCALAAKQATADIPIVFQPGIFLVASTSLTPVASLRCRLPLVAQRRNRLYSAQFRQQLIRNKPNARQSRR
jgi:ABC transporter substrate binding protein